MDADGKRQGACWRCAYFDRKMDEEEDGGFCRRYPPQATGEDVVVWVGVDFMDWCGEFEEDARA